MTLGPMELVYGVPEAQIRPRSAMRFASFAVRRSQDWKLLMPIGSLEVIIIIIITNYDQYNPTYPIQAFALHHRRALRSRLLSRNIRDTITMSC